MTERSRPWDGTTVGDATEAPYDAATEFAAILSYVAGAGAFSGGGGVFRHSGSAHMNLSGTSSPISIGTGRALVNGTWYEADASVSVTVPTPSGAARQDRIVLRKSWSAQTVRVTRIAGVEGGGAPALVQTPGTTWDVPLYVISTTTGGVISLITDERAYLGVADVAFGLLPGLVVGDLLYANSAANLTRLPIGGANGVLASVAGIPNWTASPTVTSLTATTTVTATGNVQGSRLIATIGTGTAPLSVSSTTLVGSLNADMLDGYHAQESAGASTVVARDVNGYIRASYINLTADSTSGTPTLVAGQVGDAYIRWFTAANIVAFLTAADGAGSGLDADMLDGSSGASYLARANHTGTQAPATISPQGAGSGLGADTLDGVESATFLNMNDGQQAQATLDNTMTTSFTDCIGTSLSSPDGGEWVFFGVFDFICSGAGDVGFRFEGCLNLNDGSGDNAPYAMMVADANGSRNTAPQQWVRTFAGSWLAKLRARKSGGTGASLALATHTNLIAIRLKP